MSLDGLVARTQRPLGQLALALNRWCEQGWVADAAAGSSGSRGQSRDSGRGDSAGTVA